MKNSDNRVNANRLMMTEIGLEVFEDLKSNRSYIIDQDYSTPLHMGGKRFVYDTDKIYGKEIIFDPYQDSKTARNLFSYYLDKKSKEDETYIPIFYPVLGSDGKSALEAKTQIRTFVSRYYRNEALKYIDIIMQLNGETYVDLSYLDE